MSRKAYGENMYKILIIEQLKLCQMDRPSFCACQVGEIKIFDPVIEYNNGLEVLKTNMYDCKDFDIYTIGTKEQFKQFITTLEKLSFMLDGCPLLDGLNATQNFQGSFIVDCFSFFQTNLDILFKPENLIEFTDNEQEIVNFQLIYFKLLEVFRKAGANGFIQFNTYKTLSK